MVASICSSRGPEFSSQHPHWAAHNYPYFQILRIYHPCLDSASPMNMLIHICTHRYGKGRERVFQKENRSETIRGRKDPGEERKSNELMGRYAQCTWFENVLMKSINVYNEYAP